MLILLLLSSVALGILGAESKVATEDICKLPLDRGTQSDDWGAKYGYNPEEKVCEIFSYGGKGGNANRFEWMSDCEEATKHCPQKELPSKAGTRKRSRMEQWV